MRTAIFILTLFAFIMCTSRIEPPAKPADIFKDLKEEILSCILKKSTSEVLTKYIKDHEKEEFNPIVFRTLNITREDRKLIRECKREALRPKKHDENK